MFGSVSKYNFRRSVMGVEWFSKKSIIAETESISFTVELSKDLLNVVGRELKEEEVIYLIDASPIIPVYECTKIAPNTYSGRIYCLEDIPGGQKSATDILGRALSDKNKEIADKDKQIFLLQQQVEELQRQIQQPKEYSELLLQKKYQIALSKICQKFERSSHYDNIRKKFDEDITGRAKEELQQIK